MKRDRYLTIPQAVEAYPGVLTERLFRRLVAEKRIAYTYAGRRVVLAGRHRGLPGTQPPRANERPHRRRVGRVHGENWLDRWVDSRDSAQSPEQNEGNVDRGLMSA